MLDEYQDEKKEDEPVVMVDYTPDLPAESGRKFGLALSAGIVFFSSVLFMLFLGWLADWLLGSSPWGLVGGIVLGSVIGFVQFFRTSSQILNPPKSPVNTRPLIPKDDNDNRNRY